MVNSSILESNFYKRYSLWKDEENIEKIQAK